MITHLQIKEVMRKHHCDWSTACSFLGKRGAAKKAAIKRRKERKQWLEGEAERQDAAFNKMAAQRPDLYQ